jgi:hypothetical protein
LISHFSIRSFPHGKLKQGMSVDLVSAFGKKL